MSPTSRDVAIEICRANGLTFGSEVGAGTFKVTYRVTRADGSDRPLKVFKQGSPDDRTEREIDAMGRCNHPAIAALDFVQVFRFADQDHLYLLEEFLAGGTLASRLNLGPMSHPDVLELGSRLMSAVEHTATLRLVHRDIKPDNIMFRDRSLDAVLVDFGLVRDLAQGSLTPSWLMGGPGTPLFASPEQLRNEKALISWATDQFALALVLSISATGEHPFAETAGHCPSHDGETAHQRSIRQPIAWAWAWATR